MSKYKYAFLAMGLSLLATGVRADEVTRSTSTQVDNPGSSSSSTATTTENNGGDVSQQSTTTETSPACEKKVTTSKKYCAPKQQKTVVRHSETETSR